MSNKVDICGINTNNLPKFTPQELGVLMEKIKNGDEESKELFIWGNMRLVLSVVQRFSGRKESADDMFQVGCVGLIKAIDNFNTELNVRFSTYAVPMIVGEIRRFLRDNSAIRVSRSLRDVAYRALQSREKLGSKLQREPTIDEIAKDMDTPLRQVACALDAISEPVSLSEPMYSDDLEASELCDYISDGKNCDEMWLDSVSIKDALKELAPREQKILILRYFLGKTQIEVSEEVGISQAQVSRLEKFALKSIKKFFV